MTEVEKKGIEKAKVGLVVCAILVVILAISSIWLYTRINTLETDKDNLQSQVNSLETDKSNLESQVSILQTDKSTLESQVGYLQTQINSLQSEIDSLKEPYLLTVNVYWSDNHPLFGTPYVSIEGTIFNSGTDSAYNVVYTVKIYDSSHTLLKSEDISLGTISGSFYKNFDVNIEYSGDADYITTTLTYD